MRLSFRLGVAACLAVCMALPALADVVDDAAALMRKGQATEALTRVDTYLKTNPKDAVLDLEVELVEKPDEAIAVFRALNEDMPELPEPYNNLAVLYAGQGRYDEARRVLETAIVANPSYALAHENLGDIYARMAAQSYQRAAKLDPKATTARTKLKLADELLAK